MNTILFTICEQIKNLSILLNPIIPLATTKVLNIINLESGKQTIDNIHKMDCINHDKPLKNLDILFKKIDNDN